MRRRAFVLARDAGICYVCGKPGANQADHVDRNGPDDVTNMRAIHAIPCHRDKTQREAKQSQYGDRRRLT